MGSAMNEHFGDRPQFPPWSRARIRAVAESRDLLTISDDIHDAVSSAAAACHAACSAHYLELDTSRAAPLLLPDLERAYRTLGAIIAELRGVPQDTHWIRC